MARWEYKFIDVHRDTYNQLKAVLPEIRQAGEDGWEAVGQVDLDCPGVTMRVVMLKRPAS
jgi:hypothetical protein